MARSRRRWQLDIDLPMAGQGVTQQVQVLRWATRRVHGAAKLPTRRPRERTAIWRPRMPGRVTVGEEPGNVLFSVTHGVWWREWGTVCEIMDERVKR